MSGIEIGRRLNADGAWEYDDETVQVACVRSQELFRFSLPEFDDYLDGPGWDTPKAQAVRRGVIRARGDMIEAWRTDNLLAAEGWLNYLAACKQMHEHRELLLPLARKGKAYGQTQAGRRKGKPASDPYDSDRNARVLAFHARLVAAGHSDATAQTADEFELSTRTVRRLINEG
jgi:hypothetical protein